MLVMLFSMSLLDMPVGVFAIVSATVGAIVSLSSFEGLKRWSLVAVFVLLGMGEFVVIERAESANKANRELQQKQMADLPRQVSEYIRNTSPQPGIIPKAANFNGRPLPPTGLIAIVDGQEESAAVDLSHAVLDLLDRQGDPPKQGTGESDLDFIIRSNAWYADILAKYNKSLGPQVVTFVGYLVGHKVLRPEVLPLAKNPVNLMGIRAVAVQLGAAASVLAKHPVRPNTNKTKGRI